MASVSKVQIANLALSHIRDKGAIESLDEATPQARMAKLWYDAARRQVLVDSDWGFARKRMTLAVHGDDPPDDWSYRYQYPSDCLAPRRIRNPLGRIKPAVPFAVEQSDDGSRSIVTDAEEAELSYTLDLEDVTAFSPYFVLALSYQLAYYLAGPLTGKQSIQKGMLEAYNLMLNTGAAHDANGTAAATETPPDADWIAER